MSASETEILADLIRAKRTCLLQLRDLTRRQIELIEGGDIAGLLNLLAAKQRTILQLQRIERALDPYRGQDPEQRTWKSAEDRQNCSKQIQQCEALLSEIIGQEKCGESALVRRRDEAAGRLREVHLAGKARGAYASPPRDVVNQVNLFSDAR
jgi:hypothetical protein